MKIGIEAQRIFRKKKHGMDIYALNLIQTLQELDQNNHYVVFVKKDEDVCLTESENLSLVYVDGLSYVDFEQIHLPQAIKKSGVDIMHFTSNTAPLFCKVPYLLTLHDIIFMKKQKGGSLYQNFGNMYRKWLLPKVIQRPHFIATVSNFEAEKIHQDMGVSLQKIRPIYNATHAIFNTHKNENLRAKYSIPERYFLFLGNEAPKKNMKNVLNAYALYISESGTLPLVILESSFEQVQSLLSEINGLHLLGNIILPGFVKHTEIPFFMQNAVALLYPSLAESFGMPIIEAMACGTAVVTSVTTAMPEVAGGAALLVDPHQASEISIAMKTLETNQSLRQELVAKGLKRAKQFCWNTTATETLKLYQQII